MKAIFADIGFFYKPTQGDKEASIILFPTVEYTITPHGYSLEKVIGELHYWDLVDRKKIMGK